MSNNKSAQQKKDDRSPSTTGHGVPEIDAKELGQKEENSFFLFAFGY
jgi:hypothetical protein